MFHFGKFARQSCNLPHWESVFGAKYQPDCVLGHIQLFAFRSSLANTEQAAKKLRLEVGRGLILGTKAIRSTRALQAAEKLYKQSFVEGHDFSRAE